MSIETDYKPTQYVYFEEKAIPNGVITPEYTLPQITDGEGLNIYTKLLLLGVKPSQKDINFPFSYFGDKYEDIIKRFGNELDAVDLEYSSIEILAELVAWDKLVKNRLLGAFSVNSCANLNTLIRDNDTFVKELYAELDESPYIKHKGIFRKRPIGPDVPYYYSLFKMNKGIIQDLIKLNAGVESWMLFESGVLVEAIAGQIQHQATFLPNKIDRDINKALEQSLRTQEYAETGQPFDLNSNFESIRTVRKLGKSVLALPEMVVGDVLKGKMVEALELYEKYALARLYPTEYNLVLGLGNIALLVPYGCNDEINIKKTLAEPLQIDKPTVVIEDIKEKRRKLKEEREAAEAKIKLQAEEHDAPLLATLNSLAEQHNNIFDKYKVKNAKEARRIGLTGGDGSLVSKMFELQIIENADKKEYEQLALDLYCLINLSVFLKMQNAENLRQEFDNLLLKSEQFRDQYLQFLKANKLHSFAKPIELTRSLNIYLDTIKDNWNLIIKAIEKSDFIISDDDLNAIQDMLGVIYIKEDQQDIVTQDGLNNEDQDTSSEAKEPEALQNSVEFDITSYRKLVDQLSEQLTVEVFPPEVTYQQILEDLQIQIDKERKNIDLESIEQERMKTLHELMIKYKGRILRSDDKNRPLLKGLYYIMVFELENDVYAVAENPLYKNATYITRKSLTPLLENESIVSIHLNSKLLARNLGSVQLIHAPEDKVGVTHKQRIEKTIKELKER